MYNETMRKFGYPDTRLGEFEHWVVLLRPKQVTLGSLVLAAKGEVMRLGEMGPAAFRELATVTAQLEATLEHAFQYDKINYLLLMMLDRHVHFHVLPRYASPGETRHRGRGSKASIGPRSLAIKDLQAPSRESTTHAALKIRPQGVDRETCRIVADMRDRSGPGCPSPVSQHLAARRG